MAHRLRFMKVLVVLDDINLDDHLEYLAGDLHWFGSGSRIIATTRNKQIIGKNNAVYEVTTLHEPDDIRLFNHYAFKDEAPDEHIKELVLEVVTHAKGLPLALKLWGIMLHNQDTTMWREVVDMIKRESSPDIVQNLKISFEGFQDKEKTIFLDITCFFRGWGKDRTIEILESFDLGARIRLHGLIEKSLVFISKTNIIQMHDLIQDMGRYVVKMQKDSEKPTRLCNIEDFEDVMVNNTGTMAVEAVWLFNSEKICFSKEAMKSMQRLRILCINHDPWLSQSDSDVNVSIEYLPNNLCCIVWPGYPWKLLPQNFNPTRLVHLDLPGSALHYLWNETKQLPSLRRLNLRYSESMKSTPDFTGMPNLEYLDLSGCSSLEEVHHSLRCSRKLIRLDLSECESLERFPYVNVESLEYLDVHCCSSLEELPAFLGIREQAHLTELNLSGMNNLASLPSSICKLKGLIKLDVSLCSKLESLPEEIGDLEKLEELDARYTLISRPPSSLVRLNKLKLLTFAKEESEDFVYFVFPQVNEGLLSLENLDLSNCNLIDGGLPENIGSLSSLEELDLSGNNFEHLPRSIAQVGALLSLDLSYCKKLTQLPEFPQQLYTIFADWNNYLICNSLFQNISSLQHDISCRVFTSRWKDIPTWFHHRGTGTSLSVNLREKWYVSDKFLGFAVCYSGKLTDFTAHLIPICDDDGTSFYDSTLRIEGALVRGATRFVFYDSVINFLLVPLAGLWDASNANGKTPNDYGHFRLFSTGEKKKFGVSLLYKDEMSLTLG